MKKSRKNNKPEVDNFDFECVLWDENGLPICYIRNENNKVDPQGKDKPDPYSDHSFSILKNRSNLYYRGKDFSSRDFMDNIIKQNQKIIDQLEEAKSAHDLPPEKR